MTIKDIAKLAGVSISTVSKIVNEKDQNINPETRSRVLKIVKEYNYTPYGTVKNRSVSKSFQIGVLLKNAQQRHEIIDGILAQAQCNGYHILLLDSQNNLERELRHITVLCKNQVDGLIWEPVCDTSQKYLTDLEAQHIPICGLNASFLEPSYQIDFEQIGYLLTEKLIQFKHSKLACFLEAENSHCNQLLEGFQRCLYENQISYRHRLAIYPDTTDVAQEIINRNYTGILCSNDSLALRLYEELYKQHYFIPSDLSVVSVLTHSHEHFYPHLSGIKLPFHEFGSFLCSQLISKCEKKAEQSLPMFTPVLPFEMGNTLDFPSTYRAQKIVVIGSINVDLTFNVDQLPQSGRSTTIRSSTFTAGGKGANQSIGAAKLGHEVSLIGQVGNDTDASFIFDILESSQVISQGVHREGSLPTGKAYIYIETSGESAITILPGANASLTPQIIRNRKRYFENSGFCLISSEIPIESVIEAAITAHTYGAKTILKPAALPSIPEILWQYTDIFVPNQKEASTLCPFYQTIEEQADYFFQQGVETVILTLGPNGCYLKTKTQACYFPAADFTAIDTTGGADAFIAALASYLIKGYALENAIKIATYAAGFCVSRQGTVPSLVDKNTLETHIAQKEPSLIHHLP